ncbi:MAG TPA: TIGR02921 family PEP-CTERM protein [Anaerolineae bacterium]|nr:TIGR02921 family PEP-CTERM protein [Anaerolineae bacterium]
MFTAESREAAALYQQYFDQPIIDGERERIVRAAKSNWNVATARTDLQLVDDREVHLDEQTIRVNEHGDWAEVELYEVYSNRTTNQQEVLYYFSLPESAVITGLWLGNSSVKADAFVYRVSPRGAAQQIFQEQVQVRRDPALVEQLGPTQYRLRVFPVAPMRHEYSSGFRSELVAGARQHMWLTYRVLASDAGWQLPQLSVLRNVYWDGQTQYLLNGENYRPDKAAWLPQTVPATASDVATGWQQVDFDTGQSVLLRKATADDIPPLPSDLKLALVLDRSLSMQAYERDVAATLRQLQAQNLDVDLYLTASAVRGEAPSKVDLAQFEVEEMVYFGGQNSAELLQQFDALQTGQTYDAILVLTDASGYELGAPAAPVPHPAAPVWMIHLGGYPLGYDDDTLEAIQASGGGSVLSMAAALDRIAVAQQHDRIGYDITDGYVWATVPTAEAAALGASTINPNLAPFAARRLILSDMLSQRDHLDALESLDDLHAIAVENSIVTPYSSMIVLVNEAQNRRLDQLENRDDRFEREFEEVDITSDSALSGLSAVPEPHEYLLMALAGLMLLWYLKNQRQVAGLRSGKVAK